MSVRDCSLIFGFIQIKHGDDSWYIHVDDGSENTVELLTELLNSRTFDIGPTLWLHMLLSMAH